MIFMKKSLKILITLTLIICILLPSLCYAQDSVCVPILMYHSVTDDEPDNPYAISLKLFEEHISGLIEMGYTPVFLSQLADYVENGKDLPQKPICITFDDGYQNNYTNAYPILKKYNAKATIFVIGVSVGKSMYKDTTYEMSPHFGYNEAREMVKSGLIDIQSHTYDMHQWPAFEGGIARENILRLEGESIMDYVLKLRRDISMSRKKIEGELGKKLYAVAYPTGRYDNITELTLKNMNIRVTLATTMGNNYLKKGDTSSLYRMNRFNMNSDITMDVLINMIGN